MNSNILITKKAIKEWDIKIDEIKLDVDGRVWLENELTDLIWNITYTPCCKDTQTIIITVCEPNEK